ncbi:MAG: tetratricopeptide repeat protein [Myxococcota bacterium]|nr:tetratricopeptide repeat protein [Myxococcota bacterium]
MKSQLIHFAGVLLLGFTLTSGARAAPLTDRSNRLAQAKQMQQRGEYNRAETLLNQLLVVHPKDTQVIMLRGIGYLQMARFRQAHADFLSVCELNPKQAEAFYNRGVASLALGDYANAIVDFGRALKMKPSDIRPKRSRAIAYRAVGRPQRALTDLNQLIQSSSKTAGDFRERALVYLALAKPNRALKDAIEATKQAPKNAQNWMVRAELSERVGRMTAAIEATEQAIRIEPDNASHRLIKARLLRRLNRPADALAVLDKALNGSEVPPLMFVERGELRGQKGDTEGALADFEAAVKLTPKNGRAQFGLAVTLARLKKFDRAILAARRAAHVSPHHVEVLRMLATLLETQGNPTEAATFRQRAQALERPPTAQ